MIYRCVLVHSQTQSNIALEEVLTDLRRTVTNATTNEQEQTIGNLAMVAAAFERLAQLIDEGTVIPNTVSLLLTNMSMYSNGLSPASLFSNFPVSDSAGLDQHIGQLATMEQRCAASKCLKVSLDTSCKICKHISNSSG